MKEWLVGDITLRSYGTDKYGRVLGDVFCEHGNVADLLKKKILQLITMAARKQKNGENKMQISEEGKQLIKNLKDVLLTVTWLLVIVVPPMCLQ